MAILNSTNGELKIQMEEIKRLVDNNTQSFFEKEKSLESIISKLKVDLNKAEEEVGNLRRYVTELKNDVKARDDKIKVEN